MAPWLAGLDSYKWNQELLCYPSPFPVPSFTPPLILPSKLESLLTRKWIGQNLDLGILASRTVTKYISVLYSTSLRDFVMAAQAD